MMILRLGARVADVGVKMVDFGIYLLLLGMRVADAGVDLVLGSRDELEKALEDDLDSRLEEMLNGIEELVSPDPLVKSETDAAVARFVQSVHEGGGLDEVTLN